MATDIALWGPTASGKTTFIQAFGSVITSRYSLGPIAYKILGSDLKQLTEFEPPTEPTHAGHLTQWYFVREPNVKDSPLSASSAHCHEIKLYDDDGAHTTGMLGDAGPDKFRQTLEHVAGAKCIIIMLDPTLIVDENPEDPNAITKRKYFSWIQTLAVILKSPEYSKERYISVCVSKIDTIGENLINANSKTIVRSLFNSNEIDMYSLLESLNDGLTKVKIIPISSKQGSASKLLTPINVEQAMFWLFEFLERKSIEDKEGKPFLIHFLKADRLKLYKKYPRGKK